MSLSLYDLYVKKNFDLVRSLVIKHDLIAQTINANLRLYGYSVSENLPETWKYYLNLSGQYHESDLPMTIISLDTLETIDFTLANLNIHKATRRGYLNNSTYYKELIAKFPYQETLINGILNPIDINLAINAKNYSIISYDKTLVEVNEYNLINDIETWINLFFTRWNVSDYYFVDPLYVPNMYGIMVAYLPTLVNIIRLGYCHTDQVHSYHIGEYLASNGGLDKYIDALTKKQQLFLYRNIRYLYNNVGKTKTFNLLVDRLLTERNLPLAMYEVDHNTKDVLVDLQPTVDLVRKPLNQQAIDGRDELFTVEEILIKELPKAKDNSLYFNEDLVTISDKLTYSPIDNLPTKVLESDILDDSLDGVYNLYSMLINHWGYLSSINLFNPIVSFTDPLTNIKVSLRAKDAFIYYLYCLNRAYGYTPNNVMDLLVNDVRRPTLPTVAELRNITESKFITLSEINNAINDNVTITNIVSSEGFYGVINDIYLKRKKQRLQWSYADGYKKRMNVKLLYQRFYVDKVIKLTPSTISYNQWLLSKGLDVSKYSKYEFERLYIDIAKQAIGIINNNVKTLKQIQNASIAIMEQLSSYSVQYITNINETPYLSMGWSQICIGDIESSTSGIIEVDTTPLRVMSKSSKPNATVKTGDHIVIGVNKIENRKALSANGNVGMVITMDKIPSQTISGSIGSVTVGSLEVNGVTYYDGQDPNSTLLQNSNI